MDSVVHAMAVLPARTDAVIIEEGKASSVDDSFRFRQPLGSAVHSMVAQWECGETIEIMETAAGRRATERPSRWPDPRHEDQHTGIVIADGGAGQNEVLFVVIVRRDAHGAAQRNNT